MMKYNRCDLNEHFEKLVSQCAPKNIRKSFLSVSTRGFYWGLNVAFFYKMTNKFFPVNSVV